MDASHTVAQRGVRAISGLWFEDAHLARSRRGSRSSPTFTRPRERKRDVASLRFSIAAGWPESSSLRSRSRHACSSAGGLTHTSWPLAHARALLVAIAVTCYFVSFVVRARGWHRLFPREQRPDQARCLASVGAAAASGAVLPFRLDYLVKIGTLRRLGGVRIGLEAIALSIVSLGMLDAVAMLPLSISATATSSGELPWAAADRRRVRPRLRCSARWRALESRACRCSAAAAACSGCPTTSRRTGRPAAGATRHRRRIPLHMLDDACSGQRPAPERSRLPVLSLDDALRALPERRRGRHPDHRRRRSREPRGHRRHPARARRRQGCRDQLLARVRVSSSSQARVQPHLRALPSPSRPADSIRRVPRPLHT